MVCNQAKDPGIPGVGLVIPHSAIPRDGSAITGLRKNTKFTPKHMLKNIIIYFINFKVILIKYIFDDLSQMPMWVLSVTVIYML